MKFFVFLLYSTFVYCCFGVNRRPIESKILDSILDGYDPRVLPEVYNEAEGQYGPTIVRVNTFVRNIEELNEKKGELKMQLTFRMQWNDKRLAFNTTGINRLQTKEVHRIWIPDVFFSNEKEAHFHDILVPNVLLRIFPNGDVLFSRRITLTVSCPMDFRYFPNNINSCGFKIASYGYTTENLVFMWKDGDPLQITKNLFLPNYVLSKFETDYCNSRTTTGEYSCLNALFSLESTTCNYWKQIYLPCAFLLLISYLAFWMSHEQILLRIVLSLTSFAILFAKLYIVKSPVSNLGYYTSHDYWSLYSSLLSFFVILETVVVFSLKSSKSNVALPNGEIDTMLCENKNGNVFKGHSLMKKFTISKLIDVCSRIGFIIIFFIIYGVSF